MYWSGGNLMEYQLNVTETNFAEVLKMTAEIPVVFQFFSQRDPASVELDNLLHRIFQEYPNQFLLATINCDEQPMIAAQFRIQVLPTLYFFVEGQPVDVITGAISEPELRLRLNNILPKEQDLKFQQALDLLQNQQYDEALPLLKSAWELTDKKNSDFALLYAETYLAMKKVEPAKAILEQIPLQDRDSRWQGLQAQIELLIQAMDSPEIQQLQADYAQHKTPDIAIKLANQLHQSQRNEEALNLLFSWLKNDLNAYNGEIRSQFLAILAAMGNTEPLTGIFRRQLYSLMY